MDNTTVSTSDNSLWLRFFTSLVKRQIIWYAGASLLSGLIICLSTVATAEIGMTIISSIIGVMGLMLYFSPLTFTSIKSPAILISLPVKASLKALTFLLYELVAVPVIVYLPCCVIVSIGLLAGLDHAGIDLYLSLASLGSWISSLAQGWVIVLIILLITFLCKTNVTLKAIGAYIGYNLLVGILGAIYGFSMVYHSADNMEQIDKLMSGKTVSAENVFDIFPGIQSLIHYVSIFHVLLAAILIAVTYRKLKTLQE